VVSDGLSILDPTLFSILLCHIMTIQRAFQFSHVFSKCSPFHIRAKGALVAFTHTCAAELGPSNITVNLVVGGLLRVTDASAATPEAIFDHIARTTPLRTIMTPDDVGDVVLFFASPWARGVTGQSLCVDGGLVMT
jgi:3-oxoacyl-[acyl-carrier protein] reductase